MRGRKQVVVLGWLVCSVVVAVVTWRHFHPGEPQYRGKPLSHWVLLNARPVSQDQVNPAQAIAEIGTNALPYLVRWMNEKPYGWQIQARAYRTQSKLVRKLLPYWTTGLDRENRAKAALEAIQCLGPAAAPAIPHLLPLATNTSNPALARSATTALSRIGPEALPVMLHLATHRQAPGRETAITYLGGSKSAAAVPALVQCLDEASDPVSFFAARALGNFHQEAATAVPALIRYLQRISGWQPPPVETRLPAATLGRAKFDFLIAVQSLQRFGTNANAAAPELLWYLAGSGDNDLGCVQIVEALRQISIDPAELAPVLTNYLQSSNELLRNSVARLLSRRIENGRVVIDERMMRSFFRRGTQLNPITPDTAHPNVAPD